MKKKNIVFSLLAFFFGFMLLGGASPAHAQEEVHDDINLETYEQYTYYSEEEELYLFDTEAALEDEINKDNVLAFGHIFNSLSREYKQDPEKAINTVVTYSLNPTKYGNWCGQGQEGGQPVDELDWSCARHDACYAQMGWGNSYCNKKFVNELRAIKNNSTEWNKLSWYGKTYLNAATLLFS